MHFSRSNIINHLLLSNIINQNNYISILIDHLGILYKKNIMSHSLYCNLFTFFINKITQLLSTYINIRNKNYLFN